jgi:hypothetical protein
MYEIFRTRPALPLYETPGGGSGGGSASGADKGELEHDLSDLGDGEATDDQDEEEEDADAPESGSEDDEESEEESEDIEDGGDEEEEDGEEESEEGDEDHAARGKTPPEVEGRVTFKTLKAEYPDLFKKHPELRQAFFEHPQYAEIFTDLSAARDAAAKAAEYETLESSMVGKGDPSVMLKALDENNPRALGKIIEAFPDALRDLDPKYYTALANPIVEELLWHATKHAERIGGDPGKNLRLAAKHIANYVWANGGEIPDIAARAGKSKADRDKEPSDAEKALVEERASYARERYTRAADDIEAELSKAMAPIYARKLDALTNFERKQVIKETKQEVDRLLMKDEAFQRQMKALWKRAHESGYTTDSKARIRRAWLERAAVIAPKVRNRLRQEAISGRRRGPVKDEDVDGNVAHKASGKKRQFTNQGGQSPKKTAGSRDPKRIAWRSTSDMDILNS